MYQGMAAAGESAAPTRPPPQLLQNARLSQLLLRPSRRLRQIGTCRRCATYPVGGAATNVRSARARASRCAPRLQSSDHPVAPFPPLDPALPPSPTDLARGAAAIPANPSSPSRQPCEARPLTKHRPDGGSPHILFLSPEASSRRRRGWFFPCVSESSLNPSK